jgi:hypothetical protein
MRFALPLAAILLFVTTGCPNYVTYLPDGGRAQVNCNTSALSVSVTVLDRLGDPAPQAVVALDYLSYGEAENLIANDRGVVLVKEKFGPGSIRVQGNVNDLRTQIAEIAFTGTDCSVSVTPQALTLKLQ